MDEEHPRLLRMAFRTDLDLLTFNDVIVTGDGPSVTTCVTAFEGLPVNLPCAL